METHRYGGGDWITIAINPCVNETSRPDLKMSDMKTPAQKDNCYPIEKIEQKLNEMETFFFVKFFDHQINHTSSDNLFPVFDNFLYLKVSTDIFLRYLLKYQVIDYNLDTGFIFEDVTKKRSYLYSGYDSQVALVNKKPTGFPKYAQVDIVLDPNKKSFNRSYVKLQTVTANIGGVAKFFLMIGEIVAFIYLRNIYFLDLCNSFFNYGEIDLKANQSNNIKSTGPNKSNSFLAYKDSKIKLKEKNEEVSLLNTTSNPMILFSIDHSIVGLSKKPEVNNKENTLPKENNYLELNNKSNAMINNKTGSYFRSQIGESKEIKLKQSFFELLFCPTKLFLKSKDKAYNLLSYEKLIHNVVELSELKDFMINEMNLKYSGNCKLNYYDN